jgi:hypothetical protein
MAIYRNALTAQFSKTVPVKRNLVITPEVLAEIQLPSMFEHGYCIYAAN